MTSVPQFALNHMCAPKLGVSEFFELARSLGISSVEIRNDLEGQAILNGTPPEAIRTEAEKIGLSIVSINALQRFNEWNKERESEATDLIGYAAASGAKALVLVPTNDGTGRANGERHANLRIALKELAPLLSHAGVMGLVEPLGFESCSLRLKSEAAATIRSLDMAGTFRIVHDTFHHHLAGEKDIFPDLTGLVHISGVNDPSLRISDMRDSHRLLVDRNDRLGNIVQIKELVAARYNGLLSFEPFADEVHSLEDIAGAVRDSMAYISNRL